MYHVRDEGVAALDSSWSLASLATLVCVRRASQKDQGQDKERECVYFAIPMWTSVLHLYLGVRGGTPIFSSP